MSLQAKFAFLLAALGSAVVVALAVAWWSLEVTYREVRGPVESSSNVLNLLVAIEKHVDDLRALAAPGDAFRPGPAALHEHAPAGEVTALDRERFKAHDVEIRALLDGIGSESEWTGYAGKTATRNLTEKVKALNLAVESWFGGVERGDSAPAPTEALADIRNLLFQIHELIKAMERRVIEDIQNLSSSGADLRLRLMIVLGLTLALVALTAALGLLLVRRWIVNPVFELRSAAARIAAGDFEHRVPVVGGARDELAALSGEVNHMAAMVKQMQTERVEQERLAAVGEMVRRLAHNLRNPLAGIRGLAELTRSDVASLGPAADDVRETQTRIITAVDRFEGWLADLLNVTRPARIHVEPTDARRWLRGLADAHLPLAQTRGVTLTLEQSEGPERAVFDHRHLEHAVSAILSNAIEASAAHARPRHPPAVKVLSRTIEHGQTGPIWELRIEDTGPGVPPDLRERIFRPYFTTKADGNGIGLAVAQQVVRAHGGQIRVESVGIGLNGPGNGSPTSGAPAGAAFVIEIPAEHRPESNTSVARIGQ